MRTFIFLSVFLLFVTACKSPDQKSTSVKDTIKSVNANPVKADSVQFSEPLVKDLYVKSGLVAKIHVINAVKSQEVYIVSARLLTAYKGKQPANAAIKYEAFLEEGDYKEFVGKDLIIFLKPNTQDRQLYNEGVQWGRSEPNVEFTYSDSLKNYISKLK
ncbi:hypothetical protein HDF23_005510 [Mucilaginibacter lappiensis]|uniref:DUF4468 domain-containing protein n=2 Tax=Mucilaginibacter lappiensis TaxID=354630 RepID=A0ABR6PSH0_9SPHI|nr:hypothetical protein [Mucilaginibacter lappiensis]MBB6112732.1 hypothetical protein [Mucilaginibacter lappiensis]